ncbi:MAG: (Fe-S)-binding protein [Deltaproteobacteria bacterium]|nr:(Fe-S)-binding protein [Deltaproteobacteria bacterium]
MRIGLFIPCFIDAFYPKAAIATLRLLEHLGLDVAYPHEQTCCGQPQFNAGHRSEARALAERFCRVFRGFDFVVSPSGSCTSMVRNHFPSLIGNDPVCSRTFELCQFLTGPLGLSELGAKLEGRAALHIGCHQRRELHAAPAVQTLLDAVDGLELVETEADTWCCGFGGTFSVKFPEISTAMAERKLEPILAADVDFLISTDASCLMQLSGVLSRKQLASPRPMHVAEVLATCLEAS